MLTSEWPWVINPLNFLLLTVLMDSETSANVNTIREMLAGLSEFQEGKNSYTLHLNMAQEVMRLFQNHQLAEVASVEQVCVVKPLFHLP